MRRHGLVGLVLATLLAGCANLGSIAQRPEIALASVDGVEVGLLEQRYLLKLRLRNPNDQAMVVRGVSLVVELNGKPFARGVSDRTVNVPRMGEALMEINATSSLASVLRQVREFGRETPQALKYRLKGTLSVEGLGSVAFDEIGDVPMP